MKEVNLGMDKIYREPVAQIIQEWKDEVDMRQNHGFSFSMFYLAGHDDKIKNAINYFRQNLTVDEKDVLEIKVEDGQSDLVPNLFALAEKIKFMGNSRILIIANGFERALKQEKDPYTLNRIASDWDQHVLSIFEGFSERSALFNLYESIGKHIVIVTTIGFSDGPQNYDKAVKNALASSRRTGLIELP